MEKKDIDALVKLRTRLIKAFERLRDYKSNENAIMREKDHAISLHSTVVALDNLLKDHVEFSDKN